MNLIKLKEHITNNKFAPLYIFMGTEIRVMNIFLEDMAKVSCRQIKYLDTVSALYNKMGIKNILTTPTIYVIRGDVDYIKQTEVVWDRLVKTNKNKNDIVVFTYVDLDKRTKFYNFFEDYIVEFVKLSKSVLKSYIKKDFNLSEPIAEYIVSISNQDYNSCILEANKLMCYTKSKNCSIEQAFSDCKEFHILNELPAENTLQEFINSILGKDYIKAFHLYKLLDIKENPPLKVIAYLYNSFFALFNVVAYESGMALKKNESGANFWAIKNAEIFGLHWNIKQVYEVIKYLVFLEQNIKLGNILPEVIFELLITDIYDLDKQF